MSDSVLGLQLTTRTFQDGVRAWLQEDIDKSTAALPGDSGWIRRHRACVQDLENYLATLSGDDQRLVSLCFLNEGRKHIERKPRPQEFAPSRHQGMILSRLGTTTAAMPTSPIVLEELVAAAALDLKQVVEQARQAVTRHENRSQELEADLLKEQEAHASTRSQLADREQDNANLLAENKEIGEQLETLRNFLGAGEEIATQEQGGLAGVPHQTSEPEEKPEKVDTQTRHKTATPGVTYRNRADGSVVYSVLTNDKKQEQIDGDYDAAVERRVEILEEREVAAV